MNRPLMSFLNYPKAGVETKVFISCISEKWFSSLAAHQSHLWNSKHFFGFSYSLLDSSEPKEVPVSRPQTLIYLVACENFPAGFPFSFCNFCF